MNRVVALLQINALTLLCWAVAFFSFKDYLSHPHQRVSADRLVYTTGPVKHFAGTMSLPSGYQSGYWLMLEEPRRDFSVSVGVDYRRLTDEVHEGTLLTVGYSPEVDPTKSTAWAFSLKRGDVEYLGPDLLVRSYNEALDKNLRFAAGWALGGFVALGLVWVIRKKLLRRAS